MIKNLYVYIFFRYISLLTEHRRIILCGPSGTGKSYLANKLAEFLVLRAGKDSTAEAIATFKYVVLFLCNFLITFVNMIF